MLYKVHLYISVEQSVSETYLENEYLSKDN